MAQRGGRFIALVAVMALLFCVAGLYYGKLLIESRRVRVRIVRFFPFTRENSLKEWKEKKLRGRVFYRIEARDEERFLSALSKGTASALYYKVKMDMDKRPILSWRWSVRQFPNKSQDETLASVQTDDFAARVYVIFPSFFFLNSKALEYIWTEKIEKGVIAPSPYSKNMQLIVLETGPAPEGGWVAEERDVYEDYVKAFGEKPRGDIGAVAIMTDADSTGSVAEALYDDIRLGYKKDGGEPK